MNLNCFSVDVGFPQIRNHFSGTSCFRTIASNNSFLYKGVSYSKAHAVQSSQNSVNTPVETIIGTSIKNIQNRF